MTEFPGDRAPHQPARVVYTAKTHTTGGRENGISRSSDGQLDVRLAIPGSKRTGTNPEQLFAAGWSACFETAIRTVAGRMKIILPREPAIDAEVDLIQTGAEYVIRARLNVSLPDLPLDTAQALLDAADKTCTYSKATRGNIEAAIRLI